MFYFEDVIWYMININTYYMSHVYLSTSIRATENKDKENLGSKYIVTLCKLPQKKKIYIVYDVEV